MGLFDSFRKAEPEPVPHRGYFALDDRGGADPDYDDWDARLGEVDRYIVERKEEKRWYRRDYWRARRKRWWAVRILAGIIGLFILLVAWLAITAPLGKSLQPIAPPQITLLAADGTPIARNGAIVDKPVDVSALPPHTVEAFLAIEDRRFYDHWGIDPRGIARAAVSGYGGGSTITQQLAKFTFLTPERSLSRKAREMLIAFWLEAWLSKEEILERYLSNAYFGDNLYGLRAAAMHYFYRKPENLTLAQSAMLAGLVQAPSRYAPTNHYERAEKRMRTVVGAMVAAGYVSEAEARSIRPPRLDTRFKNDLPTGTYFADWALPEARKLGEGGYAHATITTTLDARLQSIARRVIERAPLGKAQVALVAMRPNGEVVAMIGGKDYAKSPFNRATQARRQPGSTFKLFVYLAALENGMRPSDLIDNRAFETGSYRPKNAGGSYSPTISLLDGFARSSNVAAVRLLQQVGSENVIETARDLGVTAPMTKGDPSLALGTSTMTLLELTAAYAGIAANEYPVTPRAFPAKERGLLGSLWNWGTHERLSGRVHSDIETMLRAAVNKGTGRAAMLSGPNFGKTGTSQDNRDALFVGYAGDLVVGVWIGNDDNSPLNDISGGGLPARIWRDFMTQASGVRAAPAPAQPIERDDPGGEVEPQDVPGLEDIPIGDDARLRVRDGGVVISSDVDGVPVDVRVDRNGVGLDPDSQDEIQRRILEAQRAAERERAEAQRRIEQVVREQQQQQRQPNN